MLNYIKNGIVAKSLSYQNMLPRHYVNQKWQAMLLPPDVPRTPIFELSALSTTRVTNNREDILKLKITFNNLLIID